MQASSVYPGDSAMPLAIPGAEWWGDGVYSHGQRLRTSNYQRAQNCIRDDAAGLFRMWVPQANEFRSCRFRALRLENVRFDLISFESNSGYSIEMMPNPDIIQLHFLMNGNTTLRQGAQKVKGAAAQLILLEPSANTQKDWSANTQFLMMRINRSHLEQIARSEFGVPADQSLDFGTMQVFDFSSIATLWNYVLNLCHDLSGEAPCFEGQMARLAERTLLLLLLKSLPNTFSPFFSAGKDLFAAAPFYVRRVERFVLENVHHPLRFQDLVEVSGVSSRSLHQGFQRFRSTTPMNFVKASRLERARNMLSSPLRDGAISVTEVALEVGYCNLSQFSRDYRERFGESPSATLRCSL